MGENLEHLLEKLALQACTLLAADYGVIATRGVAGEVVWRTAVDRHGRRVGAASVAEPGQGSAARAIETDVPVVIEGFPRNPAFPPDDFPAEHAIGSRSVLAAPMRDRRGRAIGALVVGWRTPVTIGDRRRQLAAVLAEPAGLALENARLLHEANRARANAEAADRAKTHFLSMITHELKTPLQAIIGYTDLVELGLDGPPPSEAQRDRLQRVKAAARHMLTLVGDLLDLSRLEVGAVSVTRGVARASDAVAAALTLVSPQALHRRVALTTAGALSDGAWYVGDESRVRQVIVNLLSNAVKFTPPGGTVTIACGQGAELAAGAATGQRDGDATAWTFVRVSDTGVGIPADKFEEAFAPFIQLESGYARSAGGSGLGLAISRQLARLMGGDVTVASEVGAGSTFTLWLPAPSEPVDVTAEWVQRAGRLNGLAAGGQQLEAAAASIVDAFVEGLRRDASVPNGDALTRPQLEDHVGVFLTDLAKDLALLEDGRGEPTLLRDGTEIQNLISELHGAQRRRLGWPEQAVRREFVILRELIDQALGDAPPAAPAADDDAAAARGPVPPRREPPAALAVLRALLDKAEETTLRGYRRAGGA